MGIISCDKTWNDIHWCYTEIALKAKRNPLCLDKAYHRMESNCNIRGVLGSSLAYCCQSLYFSQWDVKSLNITKFGL